jgi:ribose transport system ATP-binding protein
MSSTFKGIRLENVSKTFTGVTVLHNISLSLPAGEIVGVVGENGAGKSTLFKILSGFHTPDEGASIYVDDKALDLPLTPTSAGGVGFAFVHQDLALATSLSISENVCVGGMQTNQIGLVRWRRQGREVRELLRRLGADLDPRRVVGTLTQAEKAIVAIGRALYARGRHSSRLLVLDEPTANLTGSERDRLFDATRAAARQGTSVVFCSHRLEEILQITDSVAVLRNGRLVARSTTSAVDGERDLVRHILGHDLADQFPPKPETDDRATTVLRTVDLGSTDIAKVSINVRAGEIVGITGIAGAGHDAIPALLCGASKRINGSLFIDGSELKTLNSREAVRHGIAMLPADRKSKSGLLSASVRENLTLVSLPAYTGRGLIRANAELAAVREILQQYDVRPANSANRPLATLSGGNQQKVLLAKWTTKPGLRCLILHEPTQGIDIGAKRAILGVVTELAASGVAIIIVSSEHEELSRLCSRVFIARDGALTRELHSPPARLITQQCYLSD